MTREGFGGGVAANLRQLLFHVWEDANHLYRLDSSGWESTDVVESLKRSSDAELIELANHVSMALDGEVWSTSLADRERAAYDCHLLNVKLRLMVGTIIPEVFDEAPPPTVEGPVAFANTGSVGSAAPGWGEW